MDGAGHIGRDPVLGLQSRIRERLDGLGLTVHGAALAVGAKPDLIRNILRASDGYSPRLNTLVKVAEALDTSLLWLLTGRTGEEEGAPIDPALHADCTRGAVKALEVSGLQLTPEDLSEMILRLYALQDGKRR
ncbi:helix-turn-helix transcriptional regulator [Roseibium sp. RKSG952]|uniref:helix-turn-helix domain-containing protein n=1 Tax=Roseibium sp. RKSG952 TaxID=2529384 RepID=UPI0012BC6258|nr:helix-turn-helix transcriptional regulator [Roseibium sp. RKSG952]MTH96979.1 XRE family transcriptional regulator [Roseibium sp. RKSG952]